MYFYFNFAMVRGMLCAFIKHEARNDLFNELPTTCPAIAGVDQ
jgi:hypothetical protein